MKVLGNHAGKDRLGSVYQKFCITKVEDFNSIYSKRELVPRSERGTGETNQRAVGKVCCSVKREVRD